MGDLLQAREVAAALVDEAIEIGADTIILGLPYRKRFGGDFVIGSTIPYVLQNAPCQVLVAREPMPESVRIEPVAVLGGPAKVTVPAVAATASASDRLSGWAFRSRSRGNGRNKNTGDGG